MGCLRGGGGGHFVEKSGGEGGIRDGRDGGGWLVRITIDQGSTE